MTIPTLTISGDERNVLYQEVLLFISGVGDIYFEASGGKLENAKRRAKQALDELHLVVDDLGWEERPADDVIAVASPPEAVRDVLERLAKYAEDPGLEGSKEEIDALVARYARVKEVCAAVLARLPEG